MIKYENHCCDCAVPGYPCVGKACPYVNVPVYYCDECNNETCAQYDIEGSHYCEECAKEYLREAFEELTIVEQAEALGVSIERLDG